MADCNNTDRIGCEIIACRKCTRLVHYIREVAEVKRRAYLDWEYWGKPVPSFGALDARLLILGLAPGAHGANRTGRVFTGDSSGDLLYRVLYDTGFASQPTSVSRDDGLELIDARISGVIHCAPPQNKPLRSEIHNCRTWLDQELSLMPGIQVVVALGRLAFDAYLGIQGLRRGRPFGHNREYALGEGRPVLIASYHPSQQNTSTGKLTEPMLRAVFERSRELCHPDA